MLLHKLRKRRNRSLRTLDPAHFLPQPPTPPAGVRVAVRHVGGQWFQWVFDSPFAEPPPDPPGPSWTAEDFSGLLIAGIPPFALGAILFAEGSITLIHDVEDPGAPDLPYQVAAAPTVLHFDNGQPLIVPQTGLVTE